MKADAAALLARFFLKGFFDVFDAMLSQSIASVPEMPGEAGESTISADLAANPVQLSCVIQQGLGQVAVLLPLSDTQEILALLTGGDHGGEELSPEALGTLREVAEPALGGGVASAMTEFGRGVVQLDGVKVDAGGAEGASTIAGNLGGTAIRVPFTYSGNDGLRGRGILLFSSGMDALVTPEALQRAMEPAAASLSQDELSDILGGFPDAGAAPAPAPERRATFLSSSERDNLDLVLDIRLLATARLGRVEMPLGDVLNLGPGSVLEIGHLVDEPVELLINDKLIARGDVVVVDEKFGLRITEIISPKERIESLR